MHPTVFLAVVVNGVKVKKTGAEEQNCCGWVLEVLLTPKYISVLMLCSVCLQQNLLSCVYPAPPGYEMAARLKQRFDLSPAVQVET